MRFTLRVAMTSVAVAAVVLAAFMQSRDLGMIAAYFGLPLAWFKLRADWRRARGDRVSLDEWIGVLYLWLLLTLLAGFPLAYLLG
jgi:hypothetical protein